jgi:hypothetical protein
VLIAQHLTERVSLALGGQEWRLVVTIGALLDCEQATGLEAGSVTPLTGSAATLRALLWACLKQVGSPYDQREVGAWIPRIGVNVVRDVLVRAWVASFPEPKEEKAGKFRKLEWIEHWADCRNQLGLTDEQWLTSTPRMIEALKDCRLREIQRQEYLASIIASVSANFSACHPEKMFPLDHFMPHKPEREPEPQPELTGEYFQAVLAQHLGGRPN